MAAKVQGYHVTTLVTYLPTFFLCELQNLLACFILSADVAEILTANSPREFTTAYCTCVSPACDAGGPNSIDSILFDAYAASLDATVKCCGVLDLGLSSTVAAEERGRDIMGDCSEGNRDLAACGWEAVMCVQTGFDETTKAIFAIMMIARSLDELVDG